MLNVAFVYFRLVGVGQDMAHNVHRQVFAFSNWPCQATTGPALEENSGGLGFHTCTTGPEWQSLLNAFSAS